MTGPLAQQFAQLWKMLEKHRRNEELLDGRDLDMAEHAANLAALSVIERHVQDIETALADTSERLDSLRRYRERQEGLPIGTLGNAVWANSPALPASGTRNRVAREKGEE